MKYKKNKIVIILSCICLVILSGCSSTYIVSEWSAPTQLPTIKSVVVLAVFEELGKRQIFEDNFVMEMKKHNIKAYQSLEFLKPNIEYKYDQLEKYFADMSIDAILIINYKGIDRTEYYTPGTSVLVPETHYNIYYDYYYTTYRKIQTPGTISTTQKVKIQTNLYLNSDDKLIWRADSETYEPISAHDMADELAAEVCKRLMEKGLFTKPKY